MSKAENRLAWVVLVLAQAALPGDLELGTYLVYSRPHLDIVSREMFPELDLSSNSGPGFGFMAGYKQYKLEVSPSFFGDARHDPDLGPTSYFDGKASHYRVGWGADLFYQYFKGYYADSSVQRGKVERENLRTSVFILNAYFPVLKSSSVELMDRGIDRNGVKFNLLYLLGASNKGLATDSSLSIPRPGYPDSDLEELRKLNVTDVFGGLGGGLNTHLGGMYFDFTLFLGAGPQYRTADIPVDAFKASLKIHQQVNWGYGWKGIGFGLMQKFDMNGFSQKGEGMIFTTFLYRVYASVSL